MIRNPFAAPIGRRLRRSTARAVTLGSVVGTPESFRKFVESDLVKWRELGKFVKLAE